jgi:hypothetical protein
LIQTNKSHLEWNVRVFVQEHLKLADTDTQITICELVRNVKPEGTELPPLKQHTMEQAERQQQVPEFRIL